MFHKVKRVSPLADFKLSVQFSDGITKLYNVAPLFDRIPAFACLKENPDDFFSVTVDVGGYGIVWNDDLDLGCDELWDHGTELKERFVWKKPV